MSIKSERTALLAECNSLNRKLQELKNKLDEYQTNYAPYVTEQVTNLIKSLIAYLSDEKTYSDIPYASNGHTYLYFECLAATGPYLHTSRGTYNVPNGLFVLKRIDTDDITETIAMTEDYYFTKPLYHAWFRHPWFKKAYFEIELTDWFYEFHQAYVDIFKLKIAELLPADKFRVSLLDLEGDKIVFKITYV